LKLESANDISVNGASIASSWRALSIPAAIPGSQRAKKWAGVML
jgi:hypothetical protein